MKKTIVRFLCVIGVIIASLLVIPFFIDINTYKAEIEEKITASLGRSVSVNKISLRLLPVPSVYLEDLKVANIKGSTTPYMATIKSAKVIVDLLPLLNKHVRLSHISIESPLINLEKVSGKANWDLAPDLEVKPEKETQDNKKQDYPVTIAIDRIEVIKGNVIYKENEKSYTLRDLTTTARLNSLKGPLQAKGYVDIEGYDLNFDIDLKEFSDELPLKISFDTVGLEGSIEGKFFLKTTTFKGDVEVKTHGNDVVKKYLEKDSYMASFLKDSLGIRTYLVASPNAVNFQNLDIDVEGQKITGLAQVALTPLKVSLDLRGFPGGTTLSVAMSPSGKTTQGTMNLDSSNPKKFLTWLKLPTESITEDLSSKLKFTTDVSFEKTLFTFKKIALIYRRASLEGNLKIDSRLGQYTYDLSLNNFSNLLKDFGIAAEKDLGTLRAQGDTTFKDTIKTRSSFQLGQTQAYVEGSLGSLLNPAFKTSLKITSDNLSPLLSIGTQEPLPFKKLKFSTLIEGSLKDLTFKDLQATLSTDSMTLPLTGQLKMAFLNKPTLSGELLISDVKTDLLVSASPQGASAQPSSKAVGAAHSSSLPVHAWSTVPFNFDILKTFNMDLDVTLKRLSFKEWALEMLKGKIKIMDGTLEVSKFRGKSFQGDFNLEASLQGGSVPAFKLISSLKEADVKGLFSKDVSTFKIVGGKIDALVNLSSKGKHLQEWVSGLKGRFSLNGKEGVLQGIDLKMLSDKLKKINNLGALAHLFSTPGQTKFQKLSGDCEFNKGVGVLKNVTLLAEGGEGSATGTINLPAYTLNVDSQFILTEHPDVPPFKVHVHGPLDNPQKDFDFKGLQTYLVKNIFNLLGGDKAKGSLGGLVEGLLGKTAPSDQSSSDKQSSPASPPADDSKNSSTPQDIIKKPEQALKSLLKGFF